MRKSYSKLGRSHKHLGYAIGYPAKLDRLEACLRTNGALTAAIAAFAREQYPSLKHGRLEAGAEMDGDVARVREALRHFVRDWSAEGQSERERIFTPILKVLAQVLPENRGEMKVLVPGSGLGRLAWEISELGFQTTAIELSHFMTLALRFLLSPTSTSTFNQHILHPYASWFSHQRTTANNFHAVTFPDVLPRHSSSFVLSEGDFHKHLPPRGCAGYDFVVTLFFIDTSLNAFETIAHIHTLLRPGGRWINLGPLLWPSRAQARVELSLEEVLQLVEASGFRIEDEETMKRRTVVCEYTADPRAMMQWLYHAEFWVATKIVGDLSPETD
ncbi:hypothetical protein EIP86_010201 [Pleurotus ostreatoroseus]|nr:hypothetical protein EIP86_010201 [Pleurotus ostreatoroseus]